MWVPSLSTASSSVASSDIIDDVENNRYTSAWNRGRSTQSDQEPRRVPALGERSAIPNG